MTVSVLRRLNTASMALDGLLSGLTVYSHAELALRQIATEVVDAAACAPPIAIAAIVLNQVGGRYAIRHCIDSAVLASLVARQLGQSEAAILSATAAALTMNVGMLGEIDSLHARAAPLSSSERERIRRHPADGAELLRCAGIDDSSWIDCVLQHHETTDGSGYPQGLRQDDIAVNALLVGMADRYCACIGARNYRRSLLTPAALDLLIANNPAQARLVQAFVSLLGHYPPGALVRLDDGALGVVVDVGADGPLVKLLRTADGGAADHLLHAPVIAGALHEDQARLRFSMAAVWGALAAL
jgi:hypothetical protein